MNILANQFAFPQGIEDMYNSMAGDAITGIYNESQDILLKRGMLDWLYAVRLKPIQHTMVFQVKDVEETTQDDFIILLANMMGGMIYGL